MTEVKLYKTHRKAVRLLTLTASFILIGIWMTQRGQYGTFYYWMGWVCICFFGLGIPVGLFNLFDRRPQIIINENGIWDRTTNEGEIKWEQIQDTYPINIYGQKFISLIIDDTFTFTKKQYKWASRLSEEVGAQKLNLSLGQLKIDPMRLSDFIYLMTSTGKKDRNAIIKEYFGI